MFHQQWVFALFGITATVSGLAGGYVATTLLSSQPSVPEDGDRALLSREQAFPPSTWPGNSHEPLRQVLFEDAAPNSRWLSAREPSAPTRPSPRWSPPAPEVYPESRTVEQPVELTAETELAVQSDAPLEEESAWDTGRTVSPEVAPAIDITNVEERSDSVLEAVPMVDDKPAIPAEGGSVMSDVGEPRSPAGIDLEKGRFDSWPVPASRPEPVTVGIGSQPIEP